MELSNNTNKKDKNWISKSIARDSSSNTMMLMINNKTSITTSTSPKNHSFNSQIIGYEDQEEYMINSAFSWPPRSYTCSFCKREFRSAQALGGHMNVHRKDRARLRQSPPSDILINGRYSNNTTFLNLNLNQNPNPNFPACTTTTLNITTNISQPPLSSSIDQTKKCQTHELDHHDHHVQYPLMTNIMKSKVLVDGFEGKKDVSYHNFKSLKNIKIGDERTKTTVRLDLEIGLLCDHNSESIGRDLDLELRLGYSN